MDLAKGEACTVSRLSMGAHTGTHMDAPSHFVPSGASSCGNACCAGRRDADRRHEAEGRSLSIPPVYSQNSTPSETITVGSSSGFMT